MMEKLGGKTLESVVIIRKRLLLILQKCRHFGFGEKIVFIAKRFEFPAEPEKIKDRKQYKDKG